MSNPSQNGKGSARRRENLSKVRENWDSIDWSKGRPVEKRVTEDGFTVVTDPIDIKDTFYSYPNELTPEENLRFY